MTKALAKPDTPTARTRKCPKCGEWKFLELKYSREDDILKNRCTTCLYRWEEIPLDRRTEET